MDTNELRFIGVYGCVFVVVKVVQRFSKARRALGGLVGGGGGFFW